ncbi:MAG: hypothetical protein CMI27_03955 [Opitutae bacterium]|nr:hypothetical protein [Opitutae bacterium]
MLHAAPATIEAVDEAIAAQASLKELDLMGLKQETKGYSAKLGDQKVYLLFGDNDGVPVINMALLEEDHQLSNGIHLPKVVFMVATQENSLNAAKIPNALSGIISSKEKSIDFKEGINVFAAADLSKSTNNKLKFISKRLGLINDSISLSGFMAASALTAIRGKGTFNGDYELTLNLSKFEPEGLGKFVTGKDISINFDNSDGKETFSSNFALDLMLPSKMGGHTLDFHGEIEIDSPTTKDATYTIKSNEGAKLDLSSAFGINWLSLSDISLNMVLKESDVSLEFDAKFDGKAISVVFKEEDGELSDFTLKLADTLKMSELPEIRNIPGAANLSVSDVIINPGAISGKVNFKSEIVNVLIFQDAKKGWNFGLHIEKAMSLGEIVGHDKGLLKKILFPEMRLLSSTKGFQHNYEDLPEALQNFMDKTEGDLQLLKGINLEVDFIPSKMSNDVKSALKAIGISGPLEISGTLDGVFGGKPGVDVSCALSESPKSEFTFIKSKANVEENFFIKLKEEETDLGFSTSIQLPGGKNADPLTFDVTFELEARDTEVEVVVAGDMQGDWHDAMGIKGLTLENPYMSVGINETGAFDFMLSGIIMLGSTQVHGAADLVIEPEALFLPESLAFAGTLNKLDFGALTSHAAHLMTSKYGKGMKDKGFQGFDAELRDLVFAFMTPGAKLPSDLESELSIQGAGVAMKASLFVNGKELGMAGGYASDQGIKFDGRIDPFTLGPLKLKDAEIDIQASASNESHFKMSGDFVLFKGFEDKYELELDPSDFRFYSDTKFGGLFDLSIDAETTKGLKFDVSNDLIFDAALEGYNEALKDGLKGVLKGLKDGDEKLKTAQNNVTKAQNSINSLKKQIKTAQAEAKAAFNSASKKIADAKGKVDKLNNTINSINGNIHSKKDQIKHDKKKMRYDKVTKEGIELGKLESELGSTIAAKKTADWALKNANKTVKIVPVDSSPKVIALTAELKTATETLKVAKGVLSAAQATNKGFESAANAIEKGTNLFEIERMMVSGSMKGITSVGKQGKTPKLSITCKLGNQMHTYTATIGPAENNFDHLVKGVLQDLAKDVIKLF